MADPRLDELKGSIAISDELLSRSLRHAVYLEKLKTSEVNRLLGFLNTQLLPDLLATLEKRLGAIATRGFDTGLVTTQRYKDMIGALREVVRGGVREAGAKMRDRLGDIATTEAEWQKAAVDQASPVDLELTIPNAQLLKSIVSERPFEGRILKDWFGGLEVATRKRLEQAVNLGIGAGETIGQIATRIRGTKEGGYADGIMQATRNEAEAIARTAVSHTTNAAREETYKANKDVIKGVQWVSTLDSRTTPICISLDGEVFPVGEGPRPPAHWNCRSRTIPITKSYKELGINLPDAPKGTRESLNGKVASTVTYEEWLRTQPRAFVEEVLGPNRAALFLDRQISVKKFVDDGRALTLEEIRRREGLEPLPVEAAAPAVEDVSAELTAGAEAIANVLNSPEIQAAETAARAASVEVAHSSDRSAYLYKQLLAERAQGVEKKDLEQRWLAEQKKTTKFVAEARAAEDAVRAQMSKALSVKDPTDVSVVGLKSKELASQFSELEPYGVKAPSDSVIRKATEAALILRAWMSREVSSSVSFQVAETLSSRSFSANGVLFMNQRAEVPVFAHEMGHALQEAYPEMLDATQKFLDGRLAKDKKGIRKLSELLGPGFHESEQGFEDGFLHPYMGKVYQSGRANEILSMGLEWLVKDPMRLARADPEYFALIVDCLRGTFRP